MLQFRGPFVVVIRVMINVINIIATLDTLHKVRNCRYHELLMRCQDEFEKFSIQVTLMTGDSQEDLDEIKKRYNSKINYVSGTENEVFQKSFCNINIFGRNTLSVRPYMSLFIGDKMVAQVKRINKESVLKIMRKALYYYVDTLSERF